MIHLQYARCLGALERTGVLLPLPGSRQLGVIGFDGREYPAPTRDEVAAALAGAEPLLAAKRAQGFDRLRLVPLALAIPALAERVQAAIAASVAGAPLRPQGGDAEARVRVRRDTQVWTWEPLRRAVAADALVYFPREHAAAHGGIDKAAACADPAVCAVPGWSIALARAPGGDRVEATARDQLRALASPERHGETGATIEDLLVGFLDRLVEAGEISLDRSVGDARFCLGQYAPPAPGSRADLVPTAWWHRSFGRLRLDGRRAGNKHAAGTFGPATVVRVPAVATRKLAVSPPASPAPDR